LLTWKLFQATQFRSIQISQSNRYSIDDPSINHLCLPTTAGARIRKVGEQTQELQSANTDYVTVPSSPHRLLLGERFEKHADSTSSTLRCCWSADSSSPPPAPGAAAHIHAAAIPNPSILTHLDPPRQLHNPSCWPPPGPNGPSCLVDADSELARALAADPFHLDWPHW
jgi:hypothetical protein